MYCTIYTLCTIVYTIYTKDTTYLYNRTSKFIPIPSLCKKLLSVFMIQIQMVELSPNLSDKVNWPIKTALEGNQTSQKWHFKKKEMSSYNRETGYHKHNFIQVLKIINSIKISYTPEGRRVVVYRPKNLENFWSTSKTFYLYIIPV